MKWRKITAITRFKVSRLSVPIESSYATSYWWIMLTCILSCTVSKVSRSIGQIFTVDRGRLPLFNALVRGEPLNSVLRNLSSRNYRHIVLRYISISWTISTWLTSMMDGRTDRHSRSKCRATLRSQKGAQSVDIRASRVIEFSEFAAMKNYAFIFDFDCVGLRSPLRQTRIAGRDVCIHWLPACWRNAFCCWVQRLVLPLLLLLLLLLLAPRKWCE